MKRLFSTITLIAALALTTAAFGLPQEKSQSGSEIPPLILSLKLKDAQKKKLEPVYAERNKQLEALHDDKSISEEARRAKISQINQNINETLRQVLTHDQKKKLAELRKKG